MSETSESRAFNWFTPLRFGILLALLIFAAFPQVLLGLQTFVVRDYGFFAYPLAYFQQRMFPARRTAVLEPLQQLRRAVPRAMEHHAALPAVADLSAAAADVVAELFLPAAFVVCRVRHVFPRAALDGQQFCGGICGRGICIQRPDAQPAHVAEPHRHVQLDAVGRAHGRTGVARRRTKNHPGRAGRRHANARRRTGNHFAHLVLLLALWIQQFVRGESPRGPMCWRFPLVVLLVMALAAAQLLPFLDLSAHSQRSVGYADTRWSMPGWGWVNFLVPMAFGSTRTEGVFFQYGQSWTSSYYLGIGALWLALLALWTVRDRRVWLLGGAMASR